MSSSTGPRPKLQSASVARMLCPAMTARISVGADAARPSATAPAARAGTAGETPIRVHRSR
ncbi:MAG: hypothetical protein EAS51_03685 [Microbacteriaceae bacterium]|nr:MAG: hypothetical protein EAS51_03685 [Microbacteriaceae bacterium]